MSDYLVQGWIRLSISSIACVAGAAIVFLDRRKCSAEGNQDHTHLTSPKFLCSFMSIAAGVLIYSSLYTLLPAAAARLQFTPLPLFFGGVILNVLLSRLVHAATPKQFSSHISQGECSEPLKHSNQTLSSSTDLENYGATSTLSRPHDQPPAEDVTASGYWQIGIQTTVALCLHKLPEGIITFVSSSDSTDVGFTVFCAISLHNFTDGLMIALPLYAATRSAWVAFGYGACMGGVSQMLGGVFGLLTVTNLDRKYEDIFVGVVFAVVSGMMSLIAIQGLLLQAFRLGRQSQGQQKMIPFFFFVGVLLIGLTSLLGSH